MINSIIDISLVITDSIQAIYDVWFVGDSFMRDTYQTFRAIINESHLNRKVTQLYLREYNNVKGFYYPSAIAGIKYTMTRILNSVIEALNSCDRLPRMVLILPDKDIINDVNLYDFGAYKTIAAVVNWFTCQVDIAIHRKKLQISEKKPGAISSSRYPSIIHVNMIHRATSFRSGSKMESICSLQSKFNEILNNAAAWQDHHILTIKSCNSADPVTLLLGQPVKQRESCFLAQDGLSTATVR